MANQFSINLKSLTTRIITAGMKTLPRLAVIAVALCLFVGAAHAQNGPCTSACTPCVLLSEIENENGLNNQVYVYPDSGGNQAQRCYGGVNDPGYLKGYRGGGGGGGEGLSCLAGSTNAIYTVNRTDVINTFQLSNGNWMGPSFSYSSTDVIGSVVVTAGKILYANQSTSPQGIYSLNASSTGVALGSLTTPVPTGDEVALGACPPNNPCGYAGNVFTDAAANPNTNSGINVYVAQPSADITLTPALSTAAWPDAPQFLPGFSPLVVGSSNCANFMINGAPQQHCWNNLTGMAFDSYGNLWVNNVDESQRAPFANTGTFEFAPPTPGYGCGAPVCPVNFTPYGTPQERGQGTINPEPIGVTIAPADDPDNPGYAMVAFVQGQDVFKINPITCNGTFANPGTCTSNVLFMNDSGPGIAGFPKRVDYPQACPNPDNNGYVEICKAANNQYPPPNQLYDFTVTAPFFSSGTIQVPLGECSGPIQVPSATLANPDTITESPVIGVLVSDVTAIAYNSLGMQINQLANWTLPDLNAGVGVQAGDVSLETVATFTNYMVGQLGQLKICKIAGQPSIVGVPFDFTAVDSQGQQMYTIEAGPPDQGGYCVLGDRLPVNGVPAAITEDLGPTSPYQVSSIAVECNGCTYNVNLAQSTVTTGIGAGITEVDFTDVAKAMLPTFYNNLSSGGNPYQCGPTGWPVAGSMSPWHTSYTQAAEFTSQATGSVSQIDVAVSPVGSGTNSFFVALYTDSNNLPGTEIAQFSNQVAVGCPGLVSITGISGLELTAGTSYFLVVGPTNLSSNTYELWDLNNQSPGPAMGLHLDATSGCTNGTGNGCNWNSLGTQILAAFDVL